MRVNKVVEEWMHRQRQYYANDRTGSPLSLFKCKWNSAAMEPSKNGCTDNASITPTIERVHRTVEEWMHRQRQYYANDRTGAPNRQRMDAPTTPVLRQ
jgi:hypothetical protein